LSRQRWMISVSRSASRVRYGRIRSSTTRS
jgi:hypothetical protein